ncbi:hypothetical protein P4E94_01985 [Pontiellaceae bacterium B12219]|nr:hypothetical protein [Pontiellaceae bacterium B12219]
MASTQYTRSRSAFWMRLNENPDGSVNIFISGDLVGVFSNQFPLILNSAPKGWQNSNGGTKNIWIPSDRASGIDLEGIRRWAEFAGNQSVWLMTSKLSDCFSGSELECCVAADFNSIFDDKEIHGRSELGEAEYQLKYHAGDLSQSEGEHYCAIMSNALLAVYDLLPLRKFSFGENSTPVVSSIPANENSGGFARVLAGHVAQRKEAEFMEPKLRVSKPQMKGLNVQQKVLTWSSIYGVPGNVDCGAVSFADRDVVIVDDLYQSGISMWAYAKFLKEAGARRVFGLVGVKSMRDSDNT